MIFLSVFFFSFFLCFFLIFFKPHFLFFVVLSLTNGSACSEAQYYFHSFCSVPFTLIRSFCPSSFSSQYVFPLRICPAMTHQHHCRYFLEQTILIFSVLFEIVSLNFFKGWSLSNSADSCLNIILIVSVLPGCISSANSPLSAIFRHPLPANSYFYTLSLNVNTN